MNQAKANKKNSTVTICQCNYSDNYYGDQACVNVKIKVEKK
jgi:hypothetical protein